MFSEAGVATASRESSEFEFVSSGGSQTSPTTTSPKNAKPGFPLPVSLAVFDSCSFGLKWLQLLALIVF